MMIDAFFTFHKIYGEYKLEIYGDGPMREELVNYIKKISADSFIKICGHKKNIHEIMAESYAFLLSSDYEGLSNSMLEALCIGVPCICTDCPPGGAKTFIKDGKNGFLVEVNNTNAMTNAMIKLVKNEKLADDFFCANKNIRDELEEEKICERWEKLF